MTTLPIESHCLPTSATIRAAMETINRSEKGVMVLVVDAERRLLSTLTDGDLRRAILAGYRLDETLDGLIEGGHASRNPVTIPAGTDRTEIMNRMRSAKVDQIPLVDEAGRVVDIAILDEFVPDEVLPVQAVIMAGGKGTRLRPLTENVPKPMLHVGGKPIMERIVNQLRDSGIHRLNVTTHYKPEQIHEHFRDGTDFGVSINYVHESQPLGTAGSLGLMAQPEEPLLVINGDILTNINFRSMLAFHRDHKAMMTVAVREFDVQVPYGVIDTDGVHVKGCREKPVLRFFVNAGIYLLQPSAYAHIPADVKFDMTDLIDSLLAAGHAVISFPIGEYWLDIGRPADFERAQTDVKETIEK